MNEPLSDAQQAEPANLRFLRRLVTTLMLVMIAGFLLLVVMLVSFLQRPTAPALPDVITLPDGSEAKTFTQSEDWYAIVTQNDQILIFDRQSGALRQTISIED